jgi:hypothetical protein
MARESAIDIVVEHPVLVTLPYWQEMAALGVPPHITVLYPWRPAPVDDNGIEVLRAVLRMFDPFSVTLSHVDTFARGVVYAAIEPQASLDALLGAVAASFPDTPPYGGEFAETGPVPHLTLAKCEPGQLETVGSEYASGLARILPIRSRVTAVCVEEQTDNGLWATTNRLPLG